MAARVLSIEEITTVVDDVARKYGVERVSLFGSYARGEAKNSSDIDLCIVKGQLRGLFQLSGFHLDLESRLDKHVDVLTSDSLEGPIGNRIREEEVLIYYASSGAVFGQSSEAARTVGLT